MIFQHAENVSPQQMKHLKNLVRHHKVCGVGECGLDDTKRARMSVQKEVKYCIDALWAIWDVPLAYLGYAS